MVWAFEEIDLKEYLLRRGVVRAAGRVAEPQRLCVREKGCESYYSGTRSSRREFCGRCQETESSGSLQPSNPPQIIHLIGEDEEMDRILRVKCEGPQMVCNDTKHIANIGD